MLPPTAVMEVQRGMEMTKNNTGMVLNIALNYGSRAEMVSALQKIADKVMRGELAKADIQEDTVQKELYTAALPDPDLLIRTSGEHRLSNFMLWQLAYTEFVFTERHWPDFTNEVYWACLKEYMSRDRRFGAVGGK